MTTTDPVWGTIEHDSAHRDFGYNARPVLRKIEVRAAIRALAEVKKGGLEPDARPRKSSVFRDRDRQGPSPTATNCARTAQSRRRR
jgi:hypothetical protein